MKQTSFAAALISLSTITNAAGFQLSSPDIKAGSLIDKKLEFNGFGSSGEDKSPALQWSGAPVGIKSLAMTLYDPDALTGALGKADFTAIYGRPEAK